MKVRTPHFDFSEALPQWCSDREFGATWNAASLLLPTLEPFLNRVIMRARSELKCTDASSLALKEELAVFVGQEGVHYKIHDQYNAILHKQYPGLAAYEEKMSQYYSSILKTESMRFLTGFCESFEMVGPIYAVIWLDNFDDIFKNSQPCVVNMWKWHWSEEYEHRTSCYRAHNLYNKSYAYRLYILGYTMNVLKNFQYGMLNHMLDADRALMSEDDRRKSIANQQRWTRIMSGKLLPPLLKGALPFYSPVGMPKPKSFDRFMAWFENNMEAASHTHFS